MTLVVMCFICASFTDHCLLLKDTKKGKKKKEGRKGKTGAGKDNPEEEKKDGNFWKVRGKLRVEGNRK